MERIHEILNYSVGNFTVGKILAAVIAFVVCYLIMRIVMRLFDRVMRRVTLDDTLKKIIRIFIKLILYFITAMIVIDALGVSVTSLLAAFSVVGLAASLAVQDSLSNLASGIMLMVSKPFKLGDYVDIDDVGGTVKMIGLIHTRITTVDNKMIYVPNSKIISTKIINYTTQDFDDSSICYIVRAWVKTGDYWPARYALLEQIKADFDRHGIEMTYNHLNVHMIDDTKKGEQAK